MPRKFVTTAITGVMVAGVAAAVTLVSSGAGAVPVTAYFGYSGGSQIKALDATITSDLSVESVVSGTTKDASQSESTAALSVGGVLTAGAINTSANLTSVTGGRQVSSSAQTANVSLLGGLITADAITTTSSSSIVNGVYSSTASTKFANLKIAGIKLPVNIPTNYGVRIPGVATVILNMALGGTQNSQTISIGAGIGVTLLKPEGQNAVGAEIYVSPTFSSAATTDSPVTGHQIAGTAYGSKINAAVGSAVKLESDPTAPVSVPAPGTSGTTQTRSAAGVHLAPVATVGVIQSTYEGTNTTAVADSETTSEVAGASLLNGLIKVGAITATAHATFPTGGAINLVGSTQIASLTIAGKTIPIDVSPNTVISLAGLGTITLNEQVKTVNTIAVAAIDIKLNTASYGLAAGSEILLGVASASVA